MNSLVIFIGTIVVMSLVFGINILMDKGSKAREEKELIESGYLDMEGAQNEH